MSEQPEVSPDQMMLGLAIQSPNLDLGPPEHEQIAVWDANGKKLFAYYSDGSVEVIDPSRVEEAAVIFFKTVCAVAKELGYPVRTWPPEEPTG